MNFNEIDPSTYDKYTFGKCIKEQRLEQNLSLRKVSEKMEISCVYLRDIEMANKYAPKTTEKLIKLASILNVRDEDIPAFIDMAGASRGFYEDLKDYIQESKNVRAFIRGARDLNLTDEEWNSFMNDLENIKSRKRTR